MMNKFGVVTTRVRKDGPVVKEGMERAKKFARTVTCTCGRTFVKECPSEAMCSISTFTCPHCGAIIS